MIISGYEILLIAFMALLAPLILFKPMLAVAGWITPRKEGEDARVSLANGATMLIALVGMISIIDRSIESRSLVWLSLLLVLAAAIGAAEERFRLTSQFTIPHRFLLATLCYATGFRFDLSSYFSATGTVARFALDYPITLLFYVGLMLSLEVLDRLRGLATGIVMILSFSLLTLVMAWGWDNSPLLLMTLGCVCMGHCVLVQWRKRTTLGASARLQIAIMLGAATMVTRSWGLTLTMILIPLIAFVIPMMDRVYTSLHRLASGASNPGHTHLQSMLLNVGFTERWLVFFIWIVTLQAGVLANVVYVAKRSGLVYGAILSAPLALIFLLACLVRLGERLERLREPGKLRILFLSHYFHPEVNAPASRLYEHARLWARAGHEVTVICPAPSAPHGWVYPGYTNHLWSEEDVEGIRVVRVWTFVAANKRRVRRTLNYLSYYFSSLFALLFIRKHDVIIATSPQIFCGLAGATASTLRSERFILEIRDIWPDSIEAVGAKGTGLGVSVLKILSQWMYRRAHRIVTVGAGYKQKLVESGAAAAEKISVIPNGIDADVFPSTTPNAEPGQNSRFVVSYVGTIGLAHGLEVVLRAADILREEPAVHFMIVGDGAQRAALEEQARRSGLHNVTFTGLLPKGEIPAALAGSGACLVHLRKTELFRTVLPSKMFEAMAMGRPVLLGVAGHSRTVLEEANAGIAFDPEDANGLVAAIRELAADPARALTLGNNGRRFVTEHYNRRDLAEIYIELLRNERITPDEIPPTPPNSPPRERKSSSEMLTPLSRPV